MPIFEFACKNCETQFETLVRTSAQEVKCPSCDSGDVKKKFSAFASKASGGPSAAGPASRPSGGGCGPSCGCHH